MEQRTGLLGTSPRLLLGLAVLCVFFGFFYGIAFVPLFDLDEGAFSEATREMLERGDFISTYLNGEPRYDKPILVYWLQAAFVGVFGLTEFAFRLPSALAATLWVVVVYAFVRRAGGTAQALTAAVMLASSLAVTVIAKVATADALLNLFLALAMLTGYLYMSGGQRRYLYAAFAAVGLGFLTKGPVAVLIPVTVTFLYCLLRRNLSGWLRMVFDPKALGLFLLIAAPWYVLQYLKEGDAFIQGFFFKHNLERFRSPMEGHAGGLLYYVPVLLFGVMPYTTPVLKVFGRLSVVIRNDLQLYLLLWFVFVFLFFTFSGTKLPHYLNYGYTGLIILSATYLPHLRSRTLALLPPMSLLLLFMLLPWIVQQALPLVEDAFYRDVLADISSYFSVWFYGYFLMAIIALGYLAWDRRITLPHALLVSGLLLTIGTSVLIYPIAGRILQEPIRQAGLLAKERGYDVVMWGMNTPSFNVYSERLVSRRAPQSGEVVLTRRVRLTELPAYETLYERNGIALVRVLDGET